MYRKKNYGIKKILPRECKMKLVKISIYNYRKQADKHPCMYYMEGMKYILIYMPYIAPNMIHYKYNDLSGAKCQYFETCTGKKATQILSYDN